ncbi:hypothetical protein BT63DRAFT_435443 [Microthyrium microscopicum]|uniref:Calcofluor white hypersensitive protein n=1 Tax=Microthyrium microscopicum TaxID=703497 RepID=A0A6A6USE6_9PEZI|nr:hypothetical protein BT63DRAFT_435443 [Microthyrium microscopicum]
MSRRPLALAGLVAAGAGGYYLYSAGGDPKVAEKQFEADAAAASNKVKSKIPGSGKEAQKDFELNAQKAGQAFDNALANAKDQTHKVDAKLENYRASAEQKIDNARRETGKTLNNAVDKFDSTVEKKASESKSWLGGWFK